MSWWSTVLEILDESEVLMTPGRGIPAIGQKPFKVVSIEVDRIKVLSGGSIIPLDKRCFATLERAFLNNPYLYLRVAGIHTIPPLPNSADQLIREATHSNLVVVIVYALFFKDAGWFGT